METNVKLVFINKYLPHKPTIIPTHPPLYNSYYIHTHIKKPLLISKERTDDWFK